MENSNRSFIYLNLHSLTYSAGDYLKGEVYLKLITSIEAENIILKFTGFESAKLNNTSIDQESKSELASYEITLHKWENSRAKTGDYIFPFEIFLNSNLPSSTLLILDELTAQIVYKLEVKMTEELSSSDIISLKSQQDFPSGPNRSDTSIDVKSCFCINRSTIDLEAKATKFSYTCHEIIKLSVLGICPLMPRVRLAFSRSVMITKPNGEAHMIKSLIYEQETSEENIDMDLMKFEDRLKVQCTSKGKCISCSYSITITGILNAMCPGEEPEVLLWVVINPPYKAPSMSRLSLQWRPVYMNGVHYNDSINISDDSW